jgi:hypothetical protein
VIYRVPEPAVVDSNEMVDLDGVVALQMEYPDGPHDAETLLADPISGDLYIVTKSMTDGVSSVFRSSYPHETVAHRRLQEVARITFPGSRARDIAATGGDVSADGERIIIRTYTRAYAWSGRSGESLAHQLMTVPCPVSTVGYGLPFDQYESVALSADGKTYYTVSERAGQPVYRFSEMTRSIAESPTQPNVTK